MYGYLNFQLININHTLPFVKDYIQAIGHSKCEGMNIIDVKNTPHTLSLSKKSKTIVALTLLLIFNVLIFMQISCIFSGTELFFQLQTSFCQFQTWLLPGLRKMLTSSISNTCWCHSVGEPCNFMDSLCLYFSFGRCYCQWFWQLDVIDRCYCHVAFGFATYVFVWLMLQPVALFSLWQMVMLTPAKTKI